MVININNISENFLIPIRVNDSFSQNKEENINPMDYVNPIVDFEKTYFRPLGTDTIEITLKDKFNNILHYGDFGYTNDDVNLSRNNFSRSYLQISTYDKKSATNQKKLFESLISPQIGQSQRDILGNTLDVSLMPMSFILHNPLKYPEKFSKGFLMYFYKNINSFPFSTYTSFSWLNAKNGKITDFCALPSFDIQQKIDNSFIQRDLYNINNEYVYTTASIIEVYRY